MCKPNRRLPIILFVLVIINLSMRAPFLITEYFGEQDAARIVHNSLYAAYFGNFRGAEAEHMAHTAPLYMDMLRLCIKTGVFSIENIIFWMAFFSLISSAIVTAALFIFVFRLTKSLPAAFGASLILQLIPVFWVNSIYGFPTMVALGLFMLSLVLFQDAFGGHFLFRDKYPQFFSALIIYTLAVMIKVDVLLASAIFCLPIWRAKYSIKAKVIWTGIMILFACIVFLLFNLYANTLVPASDKAAFSFWRDWGNRYPIRINNILIYRNVAPIIAASGILSIPAALIALALTVWRRGPRTTVLWTVLAGLPLVLFWGLRMGNSARHNLILVVFLCIALALPLTLRARLKWTWVAILVVMCLGNYFFLPPSASTVISSGRLFASARMIKNRQESCHLLGRKITSLPDEKVAVFGKSSDIPYFLFEIWRSSKVFQAGRFLETGNESRNHSFGWSKYKCISSPPDEIICIETKSNGRKKLFSLHGDLKTSEIIALAQEGFFLALCDKEYVEKVSQIKELDGKWESGF